MESRIFKALIRQRRRSIGIEMFESRSFTAAKSGHKEMVESMVKAGVAVNVKDKNGLSPLHFAVKRKEMSETRLFTAAKSGHKEMVESLVKAGVAVNVKDKNGLNPLYFAVKNKHHEIAVCLVKAGSDWNVADWLGYTPLHFAARGGHKELVEILVTAGADVNATCKDHNCNRVLNPFYFAAKNGHYEVAVYLMKAGSDWNVVDHLMLTPLHFAARDGCKELVEILVNAGADVNISAKGGIKPLYLAAENGHYETAVYLMKAGSDCNVDILTWTPLHFAARDGHKELVEILVKAGADINKTTITRLNPLNFAVMNGHYEIAVYLLKAGSDCNVVDFQGYTPLHFAVRDDHKELLETLIKAGAKPFGMNLLELEQGKTIIKYFLLFNPDSVTSEFFPSDENKELCHFWRISTDQVEELKCTVIGNNIRLFKFLTEKDENKLVNYLSCDCVTKNLEKILANRKFTVYNEMIGEQFRKGRKRTLLLQAIERFVANCSLVILPCEVRNMIYSYLSIFNLVRLKELVKSSGGCNEKLRGLKKKHVESSNMQLRKRKS